MSIQYKLWWEKEEANSRTKNGKVKIWTKIQKQNDWQDCTINRAWNVLNYRSCRLNDYTWYSTERDIPWSITVIVVMSRRVMGIQILNSCRWSGGNKTPGVNLVITRFHKILLITRRHINVLHEDITYIQYYMAKWSYIIKNIKTYQQFSLWTMIIFNKLLHYKKIGDHSF